MKKTCVRILCAALVLCFALGMLTACGEKKEDAKTVSLTIIDGDKKIPVEIETGKTVKDALDAAKITLGENDTVDPRAETKLTADAKEITIKRGAKTDAAAVKVSMTIDGKTTEINTSAATVEALLKEQNITLGEEDKINAKLTDKIAAGMQIKIVRTTYKEEKKTEKIAFDTEETTTDELAAGESQVTREGQEGQKEVTYKVKYVDGKEAGREVVSEKVIKEPVNKQVLVGAGSSDNGNDSDNDSGNDSGNDGGNDGGNEGGDEVYEVSRVDMPNCNGDGHGYYIVTYSDGHQEYPEY